jgi:hypothetical protein
MTLLSKKTFNTVKAIPVAQNTKSENRKMRSAQPCGGRLSSSSFTSEGFTICRSILLLLDGPTERKRVRPALPSSYETLLHEMGIPNFLLTWDDARVRALFNERRLERAIGVIYVPETERLSHYFYATLPAQFDAVLHFDQTQAVDPLDEAQTGVDDEPPDTFPTGM